jgi:hypothetical protein
MLIISATVGSGSSFIVDRFWRSGWEVCARPDKYLRTHDSPLVSKEYSKRLSKFTKLPTDMKKLTNRQLCTLACNKLIATGKRKLLLVCMSWGGLGYLENIKAKIIYLIRHPLFAFNSYSGGGWRKTDKRTKPYTNLNDWADNWLTDKSHWIDHAKYAIEACKKGQAYIVKYESFKDDWKKIPLSLPPIYNNFKNKDDMEKVKKNIPTETINYLMDKVGKTWDEVCNYG